MNDDAGPAVLLHLSDPHFGTEQPAVVEATLALARAEQPSLVVLSGDVTQRARAAQFEGARRFVQALPAPTLAVPGNHDIPLYNVAARVFWPYAGWRRAFGDALEPRHESAQLWVAGINTTRPWRHKHGELSARQVSEVAAWLQRAPAGALRVVVTHHPLVVTQDSDRVNVARGAPAALRAWPQAGADLVLSGHIHLPFFLPLDPARRSWALQAGTVVSSRVRAGAPPSLNLVRRLGEGWRMERWNYDAERAAFARVATQGLGAAVNSRP
jgi:3',5'-cyclic AMP phosphodiesterase CpdA